mmetsp:Transcript_42157/g.132796  ORF Transcript_42157/g.132796 Transcript_42157/m.132796 type:complete len:860 (-) Transcript_42157:513-3092(-)
MGVMSEHGGRRRGRGRGRGRGREEEGERKRERERGREREGEGERGKSRSRSSMLCASLLMFLCISIPSSTGFLAPSKLPFLSKAALHSMHACRSRIGSVGTAKSMQRRVHASFSSDQYMAGASSLSMQATSQGVSKERVASQPIDYTTLFALCEDVRECLPIKFDKAFQTSQTQVALRFLREGSAEEGRAEGVGESVYLLLNWHPKYGRIAVSSEEPRHVQSSAFSTLMQESLRDLYLTRVELVPFARLVRLDFTERTLSTQAENAEEEAAGVSDDEVFSVEGLYDENSESMSEGSEQESPEDAAGGEAQGVMQDKEEQGESEEGAAVQEERVVSSVYLQLMFRGETRVVLVDQGGRVVSTAPGTDKKGNVWSKVGKKYMDPTEEELMNYGAAPSLATGFEDWCRAITEKGNESLSVKRCLMQSFRGLSVELCDQMLSAAGIPTSENVNTMSQDDYDRLYRVWVGWLWSLNDRNFRPRVRGGEVFGGGGEMLVIDWPEPNDFSSQEHHEGEEESVEQERSELEFDRVSDCVRWYFEWAELKEMEAEMKKTIQQGIHHQRQKIAEFRKKAEEAEEAEEFKRKGEALSQNLNLLKLGMDRILVSDWSKISEDGSVPMMEIEVDPTLSGPDNVALLFKRFKKLQRQAEHAKGLEEEATRALMQLIHLEGSLSNVPYREGAQAAMSVLLKMQEDLIRKNIVKRRVTEDKIQAKVADKREEKIAEKAKGSKIKIRGRDKAPEFLRFLSPNGFDIIAGRSSSQNDRVTWGVARDHDLWFHARGIGGSHVVLQVPQRPKRQVMEEDIMYAARIAALHSKAKKDSKVDVSYTEKKHLRPPPQKYKRPGMVFITKEQVVTVKPLDDSA